jgi:NhaP-type Na+/H+ or K+/H+ antiporter
VGSAAAVRLVPFFAAPMALTQLALVSPLCVVLGTLVVSGFLAQFASRTDHRRSRSKQEPRRDPTPPPETGALERAYARQAVVGTQLEVDGPSGKPVGRA